MTTIGRISCGILLAGMIALPLFVSAAFIPVGGRVVNWLPCVNGGFHITVVNPLGIGSGEYNWFPGTIPYLYGPPRPAINVLGTADVPSICMVGKVPYPGFRLFMLGTSLTI